MQYSRELSSVQYNILQWKAMESKTIDCKVINYMYNTCTVAIFLFSEIINYNRRQNYADSYCIRLYNYVMSTSIGEFSPPSSPKTMLRVLNISFHCASIKADNIESGERGYFDQILRI